VGSSPTPGASDVGSFNKNTKMNKNKQREFVLETKSKRDMVLQQSQIKENNNNDLSSSSSNDLELERKIDSITNGLSRPYFNKILKELAKKNLENAIIICDYIIAEQIEINIQNSTKESKIKVLTWLSNHYQDTKSFRNMTKHDILDFLNKLRKPAIEDPTRKWIGSYNGRQIILTKFFRWLCNPDEPDHRNRTTPPCIQGIKRLPKKEKTAYKPTDIWESRDHATFLKYCPFSRDRCYHSLANDMSARPNEILNLKIKDIKFHVNEEGIQFAEVRINGGKTGSRTVPLIDSLPYLKEWLQEHPTNSNPDSWIFISRK
jgi:integrase